MAEQNARLRRICASLIERVESAGLSGGAPYAAFEHSVLLAEQVRDRTEALRRTLEELSEANYRLEQARAEAEAANLSKTQFLAAVSHDLLQPLNAARLFTSALEDQVLPGDASRQVGNIGRSLKDVELLLGTLIDISRLDAGLLQPDVTTFRADELLDVLAEEYRQMAHASGLSFHYVSRSVVIKSDLTLLARVMRNFLSNALRYTNHGRFLLGCRLRQDGLEMIVGDSGPGIPEMQREDIFREFHRGDWTQETEDRGLGLGLAIVDRIARMLGHPLKLVSRPGGGSMFSILVPYGEIAEYEDKCATPRTLDDGLRGMRLWVLDDDNVILDGMRAMLEGWGCQTVIASSLEVLDSMLTTSGTRAADALLVDYHLSRGASDGLMVADLLRQRFPSVAVIVITANHEAELKREARKRGFGYLLKPIKPLRLRMQLNAIYQG
ncbi:MAG: hybrid sensor histidine kinase/response regulator [Halomonas sp.]|uniref:hybrid sensor histidine kinase/response regulator n=1 Tax=Halomonas sp. TaxID=1486246 RepID=UPI003F92E3EE